MTIIEGLYYIGFSVKKSHALKRRKRLPCKVISIGNVTVGGTGKTPATIAIAEEAKRRGFTPAILTRGYKGKKKGIWFVSKGDEPLLNAEESGDEPVLMAERLRGVPVIKGENRYEAGMFALSSLPSALRPDMFILDDGYQHWNLFRDKNILLIDGTNPFGNRKLLPLGPLREPLAAIKRADIIGITKMTRDQESGVKGLVREIREYNLEVPIFFAEHRPLRFITANRDTFPLEWARGKRFLGFSGIGNPDSFKKTLLSIGVDLTRVKAYRDHYQYDAGDIEKILRDAEENKANWIVTTEKDIMRLKGLKLPENLVALSIAFEVNEGFYKEVLTFDI